MIYLLYLLCFFFYLIQSLNQSEDYDAFAHEAHQIIDQLVNQSLAHVHDGIDNEESNIPRGRFIELENEGKAAGYSSIQWPTIAEFTDEKIGLDNRHQYIENEWKTSAGGQDTCWLSAIDFLECKSFEFNDLYIYRVSNYLFIFIKFKIETQIVKFILIYCPLFSFFFLNKERVEKLYNLSF